MVRKALKVLMASAVYISIHYLLDLAGMGSIEKFVSIPLIVIASFRVDGVIGPVVFGVLSVFMGALSTWNPWPPGSENPNLWMVLLRGTMVGIGGVFLKYQILVSSIFPAFFWFISGETVWIFVINYLLTASAVVVVKKIRKEG